MKRVAALALALAASLGGMAPGASAADLGRLILTPEQREALDARRKARLPDKPAAGPTAIAPVTRVDGFVQRAGGRSTVWVNGQAVTEGSPDSAARIARGAPGVSLRLGDEGRDVRTQVGQSVDASTGAVIDPLDGGEVRVRRPATPRAPLPK